MDGNGVKYEIGRSEYGKGKDPIYEAREEKLTCGRHLHNALALLPTAVVILRFLFSIFYSPCLILRV